MPTPNDGRAGMMDDVFLDRLRDQENPFNDFVHAPANARRRGPVHVPEINLHIQQSLQAAVQRYVSVRLDDVPADGQLPGDPPYSGVILILGKRGAGKTHLLDHGLTDAKTDGLMIAPRSFDPQRPFPEYILHQLVQTLQGEPDSRSTLLHTADWLTRRILADAVAALSQTDWNAFLTVAQPGWNGWKRRLFPALSWWAELMQSQRQQLVARLNDNTGDSLQEVCEASQLTVERLQQLAQRHVVASGPSEAIGDELRRQLYAHLVDLAFSRDRTAVVDFLLDGFTAVRTGELAPSRGTLVEELLRALIDLQLLAGRPVIVAFDALESLLGQPPEPERCEAFHTGLAELVDCVSGLPVFVFAERGHWERLQQTFSSEYAMQRWQRGIPVHRQGTINRLEMPEIDADQLSHLVAARMHPLQESALNRDPQPDEKLWPFSRADLERIAPGGETSPPLRQAIQQLRDRYEQVVFQTGQATGSAPDSRTGTPAAPFGHETSGKALLTEELQQLWKREFRASERRLESNRLAALSDELHSGLHEWLTCLQEDGLDCDGWQLDRVQNALAGQHATYGQACTLRWRGPQEAVKEFGVSLLLGQGPGMPRDLEAKLAMTTGRGRLIRSMLILWPRDADSDEPAFELLPPATRIVWDQHAAKASFSSRLEALSSQALAHWMTVLRLKQILAERDDFNLEVLRHFLVEQTQSLVDIIAPSLQESVLP